MTNREIHSKNNYINPAKGKEQTRNRRDADNMRVNIIKEKISEGRAPTNSNYERGPTNDFTRYEFKEPLHYQCERSFNRGVEFNHGRVIPNQDYNPNQTFYVNDRILRHLEENLEGNPYINNLIHKSF